jgi:hypothetical protein
MGRQVFHVACRMLQGMDRVNKKCSTSRFVDDGIGVKWNMMKFFFDIYAYLQGKPIKICKEEFLKNIIDCENKERIIPRCLTENSFRENT